MINRHQEQANKIVSAFKDALDESTCQQITDSQFEILALMIRDALKDELATAAELVEEIVRKLRSESEKTGIGM